LGTGLKKLLCLRLDGCPAAEDIGGTLLGWYEALSSRWYEETEDAPRFRQGFRELMRTSKRWPAPANFLDALPPLAADYRPSENVKRLPNDEVNRVGLAHIGKILESIAAAAEQPAETEA
jgi:hypothetical protein